MFLYKPFYAKTVTAGVVTLCFTYKLLEKVREILADIRCFALNNIGGFSPLKLLKEGRSVFMRRCWINYSNLASVLI